MPLCLWNITISFICYAACIWRKLLAKKLFNAENNYNDVIKINMMPVKLLWYFTLILSGDQAALSLTSCLSVHPSVCDTFLTMFLSLYHHEILRSYYHWQKWWPWQKFKIRGHRCQTCFAPIWAFLDCNFSLNPQMATEWCTQLAVAQKRCPIVFQGHLSNFKVKWGKEWPIMTRIGGFWTVTRVSISLMAIKWCAKLEVE